jgi:hypothetical protein
VTVNLLVAKGSSMFCRCILVVLAVGCSKLSPEDARIQKVARAEAERLQSALAKGDFETVADLTHENVIMLLGGRKKMLAVLAETHQQLKMQGVTFKDVKMHEPSRPVRVGKEIYILVPFEMELVGPGKKVDAQPSVVGVSDDGGKTWRFVDTSIGRKEIKKYLPNLPDTLDIPTRNR